MRFDTETDLVRQCQAAADRFYTHYGWQLIDRAELIDHALLNLQSGHFPSAAAATMGAYCVVLYRACTGNEGADRQNLAYQELGHYLFGLIRQRHHYLPRDVWEDVAQDALERIYRNLSNCREPIAFLMFVAQQLLDAARYMLRRTKQTNESLERAYGSDETITIDPVDQTPSALDQIVTVENRQAIEQLLTDFVAHHPRARQQIEIIRKSFLLELEDEEIAEMLNSTRGGIYSAKSRGLKALRDDDTLRAAAENHGLISPQPPTVDTNSPML